MYGYWYSIMYPLSMRTSAKPPCITLPSQCGMGSGMLAVDPPTVTTKSIWSPGTTPLTTIGPVNVALSNSLLTQWCPPHREELLRLA